MALTIRVSDQAMVNMMEVWDGIATDNRIAADKQLRRIWDKIEFLAEYPNAGRNRDDLREGIRSYPVGQYLIFYLPSAHTIVISRVVHGSRDLVVLFESEAFDTFRLLDESSQ